MTRIVERYQIPILLSLAVALPQFSARVLAAADRWETIPIRFFQVSDDNGKREAAVDADALHRQVDFMTKAFEPAHVRFTFDAAHDLVPLPPNGGLIGMMIWFLPSRWRAGTPTSTRRESRCPRHHRRSRATHWTGYSAGSGTPPLCFKADCLGGDHADALHLGIRPRPAGRAHRIRRAGGTSDGSGSLGTDLQLAASGAVPAGHVLPSDHRNGCGAGGHAAPVRFAIDRGPDGRGEGGHLPFQSPAVIDPILHAIERNFHMTYTQNDSRY
jgi:hypothetical protein